ncbi:MAG: hypothetical protein RLZZ214_1041 [Verrucomicrobiota bacterium]|jgi:hypothetical protein
MTEWYYARGGQQNGPVSFEQLVELARSGALNPKDDLVWSQNMKDWTPAGQVPGIFAQAAPATFPAAPPTDPANPYAAPGSTWTEVVPTSTGEALEEILPGSEPLDIGGCLTRGFELTKRHFGTLALVAVIYIGVSLVAGLVLGLIDSALGLGHSTSNVWQSGDGSASATYRQSGGPVSVIFSQLLSVFLSLGVTRIGLNLVSGKEVSVGMMFGEGRKLVRAILASLLFGVVVAVGFLLLIVPGVYLVLKYGQFLTAIVDRDLGVMDSFSYSASITTNNRLSLLGLWLLCLLVLLAGMVACFVGLIFAMPVAWLSTLVAYRWMQYGHRAALDHPGTKTPMLAK